MFVRRRYRKELYVYYKNSLKFWLFLLSPPSRGAWIEKGFIGYQGGQPNTRRNAPSPIRVLLSPPKQHNPNLFPIGDGFGFVVYLDNISYIAKRPLPIPAGAVTRSAILSAS